MKSLGPLAATNFGQARYLKQEPPPKTLTNLVHTKQYIVHETKFSIKDTLKS